MTRRRLIGLDGSQPGKDAARGAALAAVIGGAGPRACTSWLSIWASALNVVPESLPAVWWRIPVLALYAFQNGMLEETLVLGYLLTRLDQLGVEPWKAVAISAVLRGSYHLYQGFGGFLGNAAMGVIFGVLFRRWRRVTPMIIAHTLIDAGAFIGYAACTARSPGSPSRSEPALASQALNHHRARQAARVCPGQRELGPADPAADDDLGRRGRRPRRPGSASRPAGRSA